MCPNKKYNLQTWGKQFTNQNCITSRLERFAKTSRWWLDYGSYKRQY